MKKSYPPVLYLSYDGLTDPLGQSQILPYVTQLSHRGYQITIVSAEKSENFKKRQAQIKKIVEEYGIGWHPVLYTKKPPVVSTIWDIYQVYRKAVMLHKIHKFQLVHCRSYIASLVGLTLKRKLGVKFIFDMRGFWADERVEGGLWNLQQPLYRFIYNYFKKKEKAFLKEANYTISLTHQAKQEIHSWKDLTNIPVQIIPCCVDTQLFVPAERFHSAVTGNVGSALDFPVTDFHLPGGDLTISYLGSLGTWYLLDEMLQFFKRVLLHIPKATFLFITPDDPKMIILRAQALDIPVSRIMICKAERKEVPRLLATSHLSLFFIKPLFSKKASSPTKMGEILSMGIPVICNAGVGDSDYIFAKYAAGCLVNELNETAYDKAISQIPAMLQIPAQHLREIALNYFDLQKGVDLYEEVYQKLL